MKDRPFVKERFDKNVFAPVFDTPLVVIKSPKRDNFRSIRSNANDLFRYDRTSSEDDMRAKNVSPDVPIPEPLDPPQITMSTPTRNISPIVANTTMIDRLPDAPESPIFTKTIKPSFEPKCTSCFPAHTSAFPVIDGPFTDVAALPEARPSTSALRGSKLAPLSMPPQDTRLFSSTSDLSIFKHFNSSSSYDAGEAPADKYQIHSRMMGWKLTSPARRAYLLSVLADSAQNSQEAEIFLERDRMFFGKARDEDAKRILKRQTSAETTSLKRYANHRRPSATAMVSDIRYRQLALQEELAALEKNAVSHSEKALSPKPAISRLTHRPSSPTELLLSPTRKELLETARMLTDEKRYNRICERIPQRNRPHTGASRRAIGTTDRGEVLLVAEKHRSNIREQYLDAVAAKMKQRNLQRPKSDNSIK